ncbi:uncharacterized protein TRAVEDRAFT_129435 [Trametes versicolor FP-101664 SS1]|uniref:uncharacterized protein n=1 Tax=Trametes versicolor (strain FP-101664) TaxID=717944 RepID=UPI0004624625|nr:uncharacterized protein TRAVEDRAFT_129435 [Trametes versicolor FP-101664 SS1]EIW55822.1 hypothetical protein TRAVEDRAFT_129435 [Trametes versicolor FP-101664 SS1]
MPPPRTAASSFYSGYTATFRNALARDSASLATRVENVLEFMRTQNLNLELFMDAVFWGDPGCIANRKIAHERAVFMRSPILLSVLDRWWHPPTKETSGGGSAMKDFLVARVGETLVEELEDVASSQLRPPDNPLSASNLTSVNFRDVGTQIQNRHAPKLWLLLQQLAWSPRQKKENSQKNPFHVCIPPSVCALLIILTVISMLAYSRSHDSSRLTMIWSIFLKACGLPARAFDALHALGITMSHKWTTNAFQTVAKNAKIDTKTDICAHRRALLGSHDNLNVPMRVFSQRSHNLNHFISASAATIWILPKEALLPEDISVKTKAARKAAMEEGPLPAKDLVMGELDAATRMKAQGRDRVLRFLLQSPAFADYPHHDDPLFAAPPPVELLPCGPEHMVKQHILETVEVDESSYDGTDQLMNKIWLEQMGWGSEEEKKRTGAERVIVWAGDQLTVDRIRGLARYRHDDPNSFARMEWVEPVFGWFHATMAFANSLHAQYLGTSAGIGLRKAFETLSRKGLLKQETKGVFWHHLDEALWHVGEANFLALWAEVGGASSHADLASKSPQELIAILNTICDKHISREAITHMENQPAAQQDEVKRQMIMLSADLLPYFDLREAMRIGDVGRMEDLLPTLLFRFIGGGNHKYAVEILELLHKLRREWPEELRTHIRRHCWLVNLTGKRDGFHAVDLAQEHNIKDIKVTWRSFGPGATFAYIQKISPAIPVLRAIKKSIAAQFPSLLARGARHGSPSKDKDVERVISMFRESHVLEFDAMRTINGGQADHAPDVVSAGVGQLIEERIVDRWWTDRCFPKATTEIYTLDE